MAQYTWTYFNNQELPSVVLDPIKDETGTAYDFSSGWTFAVRLCRANAKTTTLLLKTTGITGSSAGVVTIAWATTDWDGLAADTNGTQYVVYLTAARTSDGKTVDYKPSNPPTLLLKAAPGTSAVAPGNVTVTVDADTVTVTDAGGYYSGTNVETVLEEAPGVIASIGTGKGMVCFTWDDGYAEWATIGAYAAARSQRHTFCVSLNRIGLAGFTDSIITTLAGQGHEIAAHSATHTKMTTLTASQRVTEWDSPKTYLENLIGAGSVTTWCYPYGSASSPAGRNSTTDAEAYLRYDRLLDTSGLPGTANYRMSDPKPFVIRRIDWDPGTTANYQTGLAWIRRAAVEPIIVVVYAHDPATYMAEYQAAMDLAYELGVPCVTAAEAFPAHPDNLLDGGFEDSNLYHWTYGGSASQTCESIVDTPATGLTGTRSLHLATADVTKSVFVSQAMRVLPNEEYTLSFWNRVSITATSGGSSKIYAKIEQYDELGTMLEDYFSAPNLTNTGWANNTLVMPAHPAAAYAIVKLVVELIEADAWFDHVLFAPTRLGVTGSISMTTVNKAASEVTVADAGDYFAGTTAETVLQNIGARVPAATTYHRLDRDNATRYLPTAAIAQSVARQDVNVSTFGFLSTGAQSFALCWLPAGTISSISFMSGTTAAVSPTNQWFSIYDSSRNKLAVTADDTTTAWAANTLKTLTISGGYTVATEGYYYIGIMVAAATVPTLYGSNITATNMIALPPVMGGRDATNTGLTTPATAPATAAALTVTSGVMWCYVS